MSNAKDEQTPTETLSLRCGCERCCLTRGGAEQKHEQCEERKKERKKTNSSLSIYDRKAPKGLFYM